MSILEGKRALVTGATGGLGREIARALTAAGAHVLAAGRDRKILEALPYSWADGDLEDAPGPFVDDVRAIFGNPDVLVNCAGFFPVKPIEDEYDYNSCFNLNVRAPFLLCQAFMPSMRAAGWGRVVNIGSSSSYAGFKNTVAYCASKHAILGMSRALADEYRGAGVRVLCASPGSMKTEMGKLVPGQNYDTFLEPAEVAKVIVDLIQLNGAAWVDEIQIKRTRME